MTPQHAREALSIALLSGLAPARLQQLFDQTAEQMARDTDALSNAAADLKSVAVTKEYLHQHYHQRVHLEDAAAAVFLSPAYLGILFKRETGQSFSEYLEWVRIENAKPLLRGLQYNITEVSARVGYQDTRYFSRLFKRLTGMTPSEYRKQFSR